MESNIVICICRVIEPIKIRTITVLLKCIFYISFIVMDYYPVEVRFVPIY